MKPNSDPTQENRSEAHRKVQQDEIRRKVEKPMVEKEQVIEFLYEKYDFVNGKLGGPIVQVQTLASYDDCNFRIQTAQGNVYTAKFHNGVESDNQLFLDAQNEVLMYLKKHGLACPYPLPSKKKDENTLIEFIHLDLKDKSKSKDFAFRLMNWVDGSTMQSLEPTTNLIEDAGQYFGKLRKVLDRFNHAGAHRLHQWDLANFLSIEKYMECISDDKKKEMVHQVLKMFQSSVQPMMSFLPHGILQGDFNDANIIVTENDQGIPQVTGVIDFGDLVYSCRVYDVAIAMAYVLLTSLGQSDPLDAMCSFYKGLNKNFQLTKEEFQVLYVCVCARLAMSATIGAYSYQQQPENEYLLVHAQPAWSSLDFLLHASEEKILIELQMNCV